MKLGRDVFKEGESVSFSQRVTKFLARVSLVVYPSSLGKFNRNFKAADRAYFVP
jgi:hypothetical protein